MLYFRNVYKICINFLVWYLFIIFLLILDTFLYLSCFSVRLVVFSVRLVVFSVRFVVFSVRFVVFKVEDTMCKKKLVNWIWYILFFGMYLTKYQNLRIGFQTYLKNIPWKSYPPLKSKKMSFFHFSVSLRYPKKIASNLFSKWLPFFGNIACNWHWWNPTKFNFKVE
jgi:hypothetical protein